MAFAERNDPKGIIQGSEDKRRYTGAVSIRKKKSRYIKVWIAAGTIALVAGAALVIHHFMAEEESGNDVSPVNPTLVRLGARASHVNSFKQQVIDEVQDEWLGDGGVAGKRSLITEKSILNNARITTLNIYGEDLVPSLHWSNDGKSLYLLENRGVLRDLTESSFILNKQFNISRNCTKLERSAEGLLVLVKDSQEIWVFDEQSFAVKRKISVPGIGDICSSPSIFLAFGVTENGEQIYTIDLIKGEVVNSGQIDLRENNRDYLEIMRRHQKSASFGKCFEPALTPDGQFLFCKDGGSLHRLSISHDYLIPEESGPPIGSRRIEFSADSKLLAIPGGHAPVEMDQEWTGQTHVFDVKDTHLVVLTISTDRDTSAITFDSSNGRFYSSNSEHSLVVHDPQGAKLEEYKIRSGETKQLLAHPDGKKIMMLSKKYLVWVELP